MSDGTYTRCTGLVWRLGPDRVLLRRVGGGTSGGGVGGGGGVPAEAELTGAAAVVWLALDGPRGTDELRAELVSAGSAAPNDELAVALELLTGHGLVERVEP